MAGLLSDIGSVCNTFNTLDKAKSFGSDILNNVGKSLGITDRKTYSNSNSNNEEQSAAGETHDIRGIKQVFRDKKYFFTYGRDYKCYNDDFYFNSNNGKEFKNAIQDIILYQYQPYKQTDLGTQLRLLKKLGNNLTTSNGRSMITTIVLAQAVGLLNKRCNDKKYIYR